MSRICFLFPLHFSALCGIATIVDGAALVEVIIAEDTADLEMLSSEAASKHLFYDLAFMKSFKSRV